VHYRIGKEGLLSVVDDAGTVLWSGEPLGYRAADVLPIEGSDDCVVMCRYDEVVRGPFRNVARLTSRGAIIWQAEVPAADDRFVAIKWMNGLLTATSWGGWSVRLDVGSGRITDSVFVK
jgi:hypothetical protein